MPKTPFPLGVYIGNPDNSSVSNQTLFDKTYTSFTDLMGVAPSFLVSYVDQNKRPDQWVGNAQWAATSAAASTRSKDMTPVIGLPMASTAVSTMTKDQFYQAFAAGTYDEQIRGVVKAWSDAGFKTQYWRPGWEFNLSGSEFYAGDDATSQANWIKAFQHIYKVLHEAGAANGVKLSVVWNPSTVNYSYAHATTEVYPGNDYVDVIAADIYADMYPFEPLYNWNKNDGTVDATLAEWMSDPVNRMHYWTYPSATPYALDGSSGNGLSLQNLLDFAKSQGKPFAIAETGAGNSKGGHDIADDPTFPEWLAKTLTASGVPIAFVNLWNSNGGGNYQFSYDADNKPNEAKAWAKYFGSPAGSAVAVGSGSDVISLRMSEDAYKGDAQFTVSVDGKVIGGTQTVVALRASGQEQLFNVYGDFGPGSHTVAIKFLNDSYDGKPSLDRNLYVNGATFNGTGVGNSSLALTSAGSKSFQVSKPSTLTLLMSQDAYKDNAQFTVTVDGKQTGGINTVSALHSSGATQTFTFTGPWSPGSHKVGVTFLNDAYGGTPSSDRNLYVSGATFNGHENSANLAFYIGGTQTLTVS